MQEPCISMKVEYLDPTYHELSWSNQQCGNTSVQ